MTSPGRLLQMPQWRPTAAHYRAIVLGAAAALAGVLARRPDLLVLATPFLVVATWGWLRRPDRPPQMETHVSHTTLREGEVGTWESSVTVPPGAEDAILGLSPGLFLQHDPPSGARHQAAEDSDEGWLRGRVSFRTTRWGLREVGPAVCSVSSTWGAYRSGPVGIGAISLTTLPQPATFDPAAPVPHPEGLVGLSRSGRPGTGSEFNTIRAFHVGDRLRRIHWPVSLRTGELHVTATYADEDAHVVLVVDAFSDLGPREGIDGRPTSLDVTVRATGAMAEHYLRTGDRVSLRVVGAADVPRLRVGSGSGHLRRVLETLAVIKPATERLDPSRQALGGLPAGSLVIVLSPLIEPSMVAVVSTLASRGLSTVVVDTMPEHLWENQADQFSALAWRVRRLVRQSEVQSLQRSGVPVVPWRGPGSLDQVLRDISRRARTPRLVRR